MNRLPVRFALRAENDLLDVWEYIAWDNPHQANSFIDHLQKKCHTLGRHPGFGRPFPSRPGMRFFSTRGYYVFYRVLPKAVEIAHVIHAARDVDAFLRVDE